MPSCTVGNTSTLVWLLRYWPPVLRSTLASGDPIAEPEDIAFALLLSSDKESLCSVDADRMLGNGLAGSRMGGFGLSACILGDGFGFVGSFGGSMLLL